MKQNYGCAIIGAGPAGLAAAIKLLKQGMSDFILIERENELGGILNQCIHNGFGLKMYKEDLTGPEFALRLKTKLKNQINKIGPIQHSKDGPAVLTSSMVRSVKRSSSGRFELAISSKKSGLLNITSKSIITASGCRERTRENIEIPGTRQAGIYSAGQAQNLINRRHYAPGSRVVIQGSGDIGLIMARRLTIEGFEVAAVLERLPYLSGLIRNKVQCLDHFGIPLYLGRQITDIRGRRRVNSVSSAEIGQDGSLIPGTEIEFDCDTVMFAVGLIPELETVKPAGIKLNGRFKPAANALFETNIEGLFAAGNCLHINDLADSAAEEGLRAAESVLQYLENPAGFRLAAAEDDRLPYEEEAPKTRLNTEYFKRLDKEGLMVCIVCPKGCLLKEGEYGCRRGEQYFKQTRSPDGGYRQRIHTTLEIAGEIFPAVSETEVPVKYVRGIITELKKQASALNGFQQQITLSRGGNDFRFKLCKIE